MEGFEIVNKYNQRCQEWRNECSALLAAWACAGNDKDATFEKETWVITGFLATSNNKVMTLLQAVATARIEHVILVLQWLRKRALPPKPSCNFCTRFTEKGEHVAGCLGETPQCERVYQGNLGLLRCDLPTGHLGAHRWSTSKQGEEH